MKISQGESPAFGICQSVTGKGSGNVTLIIFIILHIMFGPWIEKNGVTE